MMVVRDVADTWAEQRAKTSHWLNILLRKMSVQLIGFSVERTLRKGQKAVDIL